VGGARQRAKSGDPGFHIARIGFQRQACSRAARRRCDAGADARSETAIAARPSAADLLYLFARDEAIRLLGAG